jgi:hypothetical protein
MWHAAMLLAMAGTVQAQAPASDAVADPIELHWEAPPGCPDAAAMRESIGRAVPTSAGVVGQMRVDAFVSSPETGRWRVALELHGVDWSATRVLGGPTCAAVSDAAGLIIVLAINTELRQRESAPPPAPPPPAPPPPPPRGAEPAGRGPWLSVAASTDTGALPGVTVGGVAAAGWRFTRVRLEVGAGLFEPRDGSVASRPDTGARFHLVTATLRGCYLLGRAAARGWALGPCLAAGVERVHADGFGPITPRGATSTAATAAGGILAEWGLSRWVAPFVSAEAVFPLVRHPFSVEDIGLVHRSAPVSFRGAIGLQLRFK